MRATRRFFSGIAIWLLCGLYCAESTYAQYAHPETPPASQHSPELRYRGIYHAADGTLATNLVIPAGRDFSASLYFPNASDLKLSKTWACWLFPEDTWAIGGNSKLELFVDGTRITHFAVATGEWKVLIQSLAEHLTANVPDPRKTYRVTLRNVGSNDVYIRELWVRWLAF